MENRFITKGDKAIDFTYHTPFGETVTLSEKVKEAKNTLLIFLRYYGCTICQLDIKSYNDNYAKFADKDTQIIVVLQSKPETVAEGTTQSDMKIDIACDPEQELYKAYMVKAAKNKFGMVSGGLFASLNKIKAAKNAGLEHGEYEGNEFQLPAVFMIDGDMNVTYDHRAKAVADIPDVDGLLAIL